MATPIDMRHASRAQTRGVVYIHDASRAFCRPIEWAINEVLGYDALLDWTPQPISRGRMRAEVSWVGPSGSGARMVAALRQLPDLRFEVTEEPSTGHEGERYSVTPSLGVFRAHIGIHGDIEINEQRLRTVMEEATDPVALRNSLALLLGSAWDAELEAFRVAGDGTPVRWLHRVG